MSEVDAKTDAPTAEEIKGTKRAAEVSVVFKILKSNYHFLWYLSAFDLSGIDMASFSVPRQKLNFFP